MGERSVIGNTKLVEHGIQTESSTLRAHVGVEAGIVYVFSTKNALRVISSKTYKRRPVKSEVEGQQIITATGYAVPVLDLSPRQVYARDIINSVGFVNGGYLSSSDKGRKAQLVVEGLLKSGRFPLPVSPAIVSDANLQRDGYDLIVSGEWRVEVKCDWRAGVVNNVFHAPADRERLTQVLTGNVYLQIAECNPLGQH